MLENVSEENYYIMHGENPFSYDLVDEDDGTSKLSAYVSFLKKSKELTNTLTVTPRAVGAQKIIIFSDVAVVLSKEPLTSKDRKEYYYEKEFIIEVYE